MSVPSRARSGRIRAIVVIVAAGAILLCAGIVVLLAVNTRENASLLITGVTGSEIARASMVVAALAFTVALFAVRAPRWWLLLAIPLRIVAAATSLLALAAVVVFFPVEVTPIVLNGCPTGYVALEPAGGGDRVAWQNGVHITFVEWISAGTFSEPFADGAYVARTRGGEIDVWYAFSGGSTPNTSGDPQMTLPARTPPLCG